MLSRLRAQPDAASPSLCIDLDNFKTVNDTLGHPVGDLLLQAVAGAAARCAAPASDIVARLGGDEFAILQADVAQPAEVSQPRRSASST